LNGGGAFEESSGYFFRGGDLGPLKVLVLVLVLVLFPPADVSEEVELLSSVVILPSSFDVLMA